MLYGPPLRSGTSAVVAAPRPVSGRPGAPARPRRSRRLRPRPLPKASRWSRAQVRKSRAGRPRIRGASSVTTALPPLRTNAEPLTATSTTDGSSPAASSCRRAASGGTSTVLRTREASAARIIARSRVMARSGTPRAVRRLRTALPMGPVAPVAGIMREACQRTVTPIGSFGTPRRYARPHGCGGDTGGDTTAGAGRPPSVDRADLRRGVRGGRGPSADPPARPGHRGAVAHDGRQPQDRWGRGWGGRPGAAYAGVVLRRQGRPLMRTAPPSYGLRDGPAGRTGR